ncbi:MAG: Endonuclease/exonuclease/phosphatase [Acidimicrobiales bacterium]|nr:Endonuclease/exonuclease/phosphatase [Acidimicrobiales bacterium]
MSTQVAAPPSSQTRARQRRIPAFLTALVGGGFVAAAPFVARHFDGSADEFSSRTHPVLPLLGWLACAALGAIVLTHRLQLAFSVDEGSTVAIAYDLLPLALFITPVIAVWSLVSGHLLLAAAAAILAGYHLSLILPRLTRDRIPAWAHTAPHLRLVFANVYVDNQTPEAAAAQLVGTGADVIVIAESTPEFFDLFDAAGGDESYPYRLFDPDDTSDYAVAIASAHPLGKRSVMHTVGPLSVAVAEVEVGGASATVAALNPMTAFDPDGHATWKQQIEALKEFIPTIEGPLVIVGDLNSTSYRPEFKELLDLGLIDGIDSLGEGWRPSFTLQSVWPLGALGAIARIDHALLNAQICSLHVKNLPAKGSDHRPFDIILAIRHDDS